jgi:hypothetical protein
MSDETRRPRRTGGEHGRFRRPPNTAPEGEYRDLGLLLGALPRSPEMIRRFAALDTLTREGRLDVVLSASRLDPEKAWQRVIEAAAGVEPEPPPTAPTRRGAPLDPATAAIRLDVLHGVRPGDTAAALGRRIGHRYDLVDRALRVLVRHGAVAREGGRWHPVREGRPW